MDLTALQNTFWLAAQNVKMAGKNSEEGEASVSSAFKSGDLVTVRDQTVKAFEPKYKGEYQIRDVRKN